MITTPPMPGLRTGDPRGWLTFKHPLPEPFQSREDSTLAWDSQMRSRKRPATETERDLLRDHLGFEIPKDLHTVVTFITGSLRNRTWPQLVEQLPLIDIEL